MVISRQRPKREPKASWMEYWKVERGVQVSVKEGVKK